MKFSFSFLAPLISFFQRAYGRIWPKAKELLTLLFGQLNWTAPKWPQTISKFLATLFQQIKVLQLKNPRTFKWTALGFVGALLISYPLYRWYQSLPKPLTVELQVRAPKAMPLEDHAKPDTLVISFDHSAAPLEQVGKVMESGVKIQPQIAGTWRWTSDSVLVFTPEVDWPINQDYVVSFDKKYFPGHIRLQTYRLEFSSPSFVVLDQSFVYFEHPENPDEKKTIVSLKFSHPVDPASFADRVQIVMVGPSSSLGNIKNQFEYKIEYDKYFGRANIISENLPMPLKNVEVKVEIKKGLRSSRGGNSIKDSTTGAVEVPGMYTKFFIQQPEFEFVENEKYELDQVIVIPTTSDVTDTEFDANLQISLLPESSKNSEGKTIRNYDWQIGEATPEILAQSEKLKFNRIPNARPQASINSYKVSVPPHRTIFMHLKKGLKAFHKYILAEDYFAVVRTKEFPKEVKILHQGSLLSLNGDRKLPILSRGIETVEVSVAHVLGDQINHLISQTNGTFSNPYFQANNFGWDNITERYTEVIEMTTEKSGKPSFGYFDAGKYFNKSTGLGRGLLHIRITPFDKTKKRAYGKGDTRFLLVSDLGLVAKKTASGEYEIFTQSIHSGLPVAGVSLEVISQNGTALLSTKTDGNGHASFPKLTDFNREKKPMAFVARKETDTSFIPISGSDRMLEYSRFDVGGIRTNGELDRLTAYLFTDRGLYRPGESVHLAAVVRSFDWKSKLKGIPVEWVISDPKNQEFYKEFGVLTENGFNELTSKTIESSFVGTYIGSLYLIKGEQRQGLLGSVQFRVEEFVPDRLKISSGFSVPETSGWVAPENLKAWVRLANLFGFPAEKHKIRASLELQPAYPQFSGYKDYTFHSPIKTDKSYSLQEFPEAETNPKGEVEFSLDLDRFARGNYYVKFEADGFEAESGRSVSSQTSILVSPLKYFVGFKTESDLSYLKLNTDHTIEFLAVDNTLKKTEVPNLKLVLTEVQTLSVLTKQATGTYQYESTQREKELSRTDFALNNSVTKWKIPTENPGDYVVSLVNQQGDEVAKTQFSIIGNANLIGRLDRSAQIQLKLNRNDFEQGEEIEMQIRAPYVGAGLITIERDKIYASKWFKTTSTNSIQSIRVPAGLEGNAYVNVTFLRDSSSKEIYLSPLTYAVTPFSVGIKKRTIDLDLKIPQEIKPGQDLVIEYKGSKKGKIVLIAVDEGILQVAKYQTPNPLKVFFEKRALEVTTEQLLDLVLPEFRVVRELSAPGGDGDSNMLGRNLNPFRRRGKAPAAYWSGLVDVDSQTRKVSYRVPDYFNGTLRVMAVAVSADAIGVERSQILVRGDFIISPTVPMVLTSGDEAIVGVGVFNNAKGSGENAKVKFEVKASPQIEILEGGTAELNISETKEVNTTVRIRARDELGVGKIHFIVQWQDKKIELNEEISMRPATPYRTIVEAGTLKDSKKEILITRQTYQELSERQISVSLLPISLGHGLSHFLTTNVYGCTEQLVSKAMPSLVLGDKPDFGFSRQQRDESFKNALQILRQRQNSSGGFGLYTSYDQTAYFPTIYAIQYLVEAKDRGYRIPEDLWIRLRAFLSNEIRKTPHDLYTLRLQAYALYLLARMGITVGNETATLQKEIAHLKLEKAFEGDLGAAFLAGALKQMKQDALADRMMKQVKIDLDIQAAFLQYYDGFIHNSFVLYLVAKHFPEQLVKVETSGVDSIVKLIQQARYNTLNSAIAILALEALSNSDQVPIELDVAVQELNEKDLAQDLVLPKKLFPKVKFSINAKKIQLTGRSEKQKYYQMTQSGFDKISQLKASSQGIEIFREIRLVEGKDKIEKLNMGDEAEVHLSIRSLSKQDFQNVAIVELLPSGFELVLERQASTIPSGKPKRTYAKFENPINLILNFAQAQEEDREYDNPESFEESTEDDTEPREDGPRAAQGLETEVSSAAPSVSMPGSTLPTSYVEPRDDRIVIYAAGVSGDAKSFIYKVRANNKGVFRVPPPFAEDMYDRAVQSIGPASLITVEGP